MIILGISLRSSFLDSYHSMGFLAAFSRLHAAQLKTILSMVSGPFRLLGIK